MACCCGNAAWKREEVPDHKFDFIDVRDYHNNGAWTRMKYGFVFALVIKSFAVYIADIYTAVTLLAFNHFNGNIYNKVQDNPDNTVPVPIQYGEQGATRIRIRSMTDLPPRLHTQVNGSSLAVSSSHFSSWLTRRTSVVSSGEDKPYIATHC